MPPLVIFALLLAVLLNGKYRWRNLFRGLFFAPYALSVTVAAVLWRWLFEQGGLIDSYAQRLGMPFGLVAGLAAVGLDRDHDLYRLVDDRL